MKNKLFILTLLLISGAAYQCSSSKILTINSEIAVIEASKTPNVVNRTPGVQLSFTVVKNKEVQLDSVLYWERKQPLVISHTNKDTVWVTANFRNPTPDREMSKEVIDMSAEKPADTTCVLIYTFQNEPKQLTIPRLKATQ